VSTYEVGTHSAFIAELLNPIGTHGKSNEFLKLFLNVMNFQLDGSKVKIDVEKRTQHGNLDIVVSDSKKAIIIENKIYASDQKGQISRYYQYANERYGPNNFVIYYLTLDGKDVSHESKGILKEGREYHLVSYRNEVLNWLNLCVKEASDLPLVRETIVQYIYLIKKLTHQTTNHKMEEEIIEQIVKDSTNIEAAFEIAKSVPALKVKIIQNFAKQLEEFAKENGMKIAFMDNKEVFGEYESEAVFEKEGWNYDVTLAFDSKYESIVIGLSNKEHKWISDLKQERRGAEVWNKASWSDVNSGKVTKELGEIIKSLFEGQDKF
jgi:hypothetical protein